MPARGMRRTAVEPRARPVARAEPGEQAMQPASLDRARNALSGRYLVALTGAGMSVESGIPPFRGAGGLWTHLDPLVDGHVETLARDPERSWRLFRMLSEPLIRAKPHAGHSALARAERSGRLLGIVTTNVDGLHQRAGSRAVAEVHGTAARLYCHECGQVPPRGFRIPATGVPRCERCGGVIRPAVTLFGEMLPCGVWERGMSLVEDAEGLVAIGTSLEVQPAAALPSLVRRRGLPVVEVGPEPSDLARSGETIWIGGTAATMLPRLFTPAKSFLATLFRG